MKSSLLGLALLAAVPLVAHAQIGYADLTFNFGILADQSGTPIPDGSLVQIIALTSGTTFSAPTTTSFTGGNANEQILFSGAMDSADTTGIPGAMVLGGLPSYPQLVEIPIFATSGLLQQGDPLLLQWFPTLTSSSASPGVTSFGQYGFAEDPTWVIPTLPTTDGFVTSNGEGNYNFFTDSLSALVGPPDSGPDSLGFASQQTSSGAPFSSAPEPASYGIAAAIGLAAFTLARSRSRSRSTSPSPAIG